MLAGAKVTRRAALSVISAAAFGPACRWRGASDASTSLNEIADQYVRLTLQLSQHQPSLVEAWRGAREWLPSARQPVAGTRAAIEELRSTIESVPVDEQSRTRRAYLAGQLNALSMAARRLSGESLTFADEAKASLGIGADAWRSGETGAPAREQLEEALPGATSLATRVAEFRRHSAVPTHLVVPAVQRASSFCRNLVPPDVQLPSREEVLVKSGPDLAVEAQADWASELRTIVTIHTAAAPDAAHLVWLAAHETYGGHHLQHLLAIGEGKPLPIERQLEPGFGPHLLFAEGAAEAGAELLLDDEAFHHACDDVARHLGMPPRDIGTLVVVQRATRAADLEIVRIAERYLDGAIGNEEARQRLTDEALVADAGALLMIIERRRTRVIAYPVGRRLVNAMLGAGPVNDRWERLCRLSTTLTAL
jgi:hypothetical protein